MGVNQGECRLGTVFATPMQAFIASDGNLPFPTARVYQIVPLSHKRHVCIAPTDLQLRHALFLLYCSSSLVAILGVSPTAFMPQIPHPHRYRSPIN